MSGFVIRPSQGLFTSVVANSIVASDSMKIPVIGVSSSAPGTMGEIAIDNAGDFCYYDGTEWVCISGGGGDVMLYSACDSPYDSSEISIVKNGMGPDLEVKCITGSYGVGVTGLENTVNFSIADPEDDLTFYIASSPQGSDSNDGSNPSAPLETIQEAINRIQKIGWNNTATIIIMETPTGPPPFPFIWDSNIILDAGSRGKQISPLVIRGEIVESNETSAVLAADPNSIDPINGLITINTSDTSSFIGTVSDGDFITVDGWTDDSVDPTNPKDVEAIIISTTSDTITVAYNGSYPPLDTIRFYKRKTQVLFNTLSTIQTNGKKVCFNNLEFVLSDANIVIPSNTTIVIPSNTTVITENVKLTTQGDVGIDIKAGGKLIAGAYGFDTNGIDNSTAGLYMNLSGVEYSSNVTGVTGTNDRGELIMANSVILGNNSLGTNFDYSGSITSTHVKNATIACTNGNLALKSCEISNTGYDFKSVDYSNGAIGTIEACRMYNNSDANVLNVSNSAKVVMNGANSFVNNDTAYIATDALINVDDSGELTIAGTSPEFPYNASYYKVDTNSNCTVLDDLNYGITGPTGSILFLNNRSNFVCRNIGITGGHESLNGSIINIDNGSSFKCGDIKTIPNNYTGIGVSRSFLSVTNNSDATTGKFEVDGYYHGCKIENNSQLSADSVNIFTGITGSTGTAMVINNKSTVKLKNTEINGITGYNGIYLSDNSTFDSSGIININSHLAGLDPDPVPEIGEDAGIYSNNNSSVYLHGGVNLVGTICMSATNSSYIYSANGVSCGVTGIGSDSGTGIYGDSSKFDLGNIIINGYGSNGGITLNNSSKMKCGTYNSTSNSSGLLLENNCKFTSSGLLTILDAGNCIDAQYNCELNLLGSGDNIFSGTDGILLNNNCKLNCLGLLKDTGSGVSGNYGIQIINNSHVWVDGPQPLSGNQNDIGAAGSNEIMLGNSVLFKWNDPSPDPGEPIGGNNNGALRSIINNTDLWISSTSQNPNTQNCSLWVGFTPP